MRFTAEFYRGERAAPSVDKRNIVGVVPVRTVHNENPVTCVGPEHLKDAAELAERFGWSDALLWEGWPTSDDEDHYPLFLTDRESDHRTAITVSPRVTR